MEDQIVVSILCTAYNHEPYIRQCLEGFVMQKTNFRFNVIIHDDVFVSYINWCYKSIKFWDEILYNYN